MYNTNKYNAIIFDLDGTVVQSEGLFIKAELMLLEDYGVAASSSDLDEFRGISPKQFYVDFKKKFHINEDESILRNKLIIYLYQIFEKNLQYMDGFKRFYNEYIIDYKSKTALVTNTSKDIVQKVNDFIGIDHYFKTIITSSDVANHKPHPEPYIIAMNILGVKPSSTLIIEDSRVGIVSAVESGANVIGIQSTLTKDEISSINPNILSFNGYRSISNYLYKK